MKLGILISCDKHSQQIIALVSAAVRANVDISIFCMDTGTLLMLQPEFTHLCRMDGVSMGLCRHSAETFGVNTRLLPKDIVCGSQFNNAIMNHEADKMLVL